MAQRFFVCRHYIKWKGTLYKQGDLLPENFTYKDRDRNIYSKRIGICEVTEETAPQGPAVSLIPNGTGNQPPLVAPTTGTPPISPVIPSTTGSPSEQTTITTSDAATGTSQDAPPVITETGSAPAAGAIKFQFTPATTGTPQ